MDAEGVCFPRFPETSGQALILKAWRKEVGTGSEQVDVFDTKAEAVEMRRGAMPRVRGISVVPLTEAEAELGRQARSRWRLRTWRGWLTG